MFALVDSILHIGSSAIIGYGLSTLVMCIAYTMVPAVEFERAKAAKNGSTMLQTIFVSTFVLGAIITAILL